MEILGSMLRYSGRVAIFAAMAALLLHASCTIGVAPLAAPADSGCHESAPVSPNPQQKCCDGDHSPEALLSATVAVAPPPAAMEPAGSPLITYALQYRVAEIVSPAPGPPLLVSLRI
jgi:hypothetical protein